MKFTEYYLMQIKKEKEQTEEKYSKGQIIIEPGFTVQLALFPDKRQVEIKRKIINQYRQRMKLCYEKHSN